MHAYARAMRTNRTARHSSSNRPSTASMIVAATAAAAVTILVTVAVVALACYLAGVPSRPAASSAQPASGRVAQHLLDPTVGRGAESQTCKNAPRSPRCLDEGGDIAVVRDRGAARPAEGGDDQTVLLGGGDSRPAGMPGRVPGRGGWVSEEGSSRA